MTSTKTIHRRPYGIPLNSRNTIFYIYRTFWLTIKNTIFIKIYMEVEKWYIDPMFYIPDISDEVFLVPEIHVK